MAGLGRGFLRPPSWQSQLHDTVTPNSLLYSKLFHLPTISNLSMQYSLIYLMDREHFETISTRENELRVNIEFFVHYG